VAASLVGFLMILALGYSLNVYFAPTINVESIYVAEPVLFGVVFLLALGLGVISAIQPARQATHVDPVDVLREA
jgi:ABC-type antimicrobial peptide transport system permease subunit